MAFINLSITDETSQVIYFDPGDLESLNLVPCNTITVKAGSLTTEARVKVTPGGRQISMGTLKSLNLPPVNGLRLRSEGPSQVRIGPLIGILTSQGGRYRTPPYSSQGKLLQRFLTYGQETGSIAFVFNPKGVSRDTGEIKGLYLHQEQDGTVIWKVHTFSLPDIVYDRILFRSYERKKLTKQITSFLAHHKEIVCFNPKFLNKWETHLVLSQNSFLKEHLPETGKFESPESLRSFINIYKTVYLKPVHGSLGKGIMKISLLPEGYGYQYRNRKKNIKGIWTDIHRMDIEITDFINKKPYVMQQGLDLISYNGRVFDIRVLMQKNAAGSWVNSAMVARVASEGNIFPNVAAGGEAKNVEKLWRDLTTQGWIGSEAYLSTLSISLTAAETLENTLGTFAEIGLDIGIDKTGNIWIIEINSKPSYKVFPKDQLYLKQNAIKLPMDFAAHVAGFTSREERDLN
ncbi:YheC/YheD family protein [Phosphitispora fastidiosa]|uniref:YheC/YheD family endospore coat-associated protein n=1 Tax=Phosphitispora fastidiosa TaxID=2837202 RepID=UPI001E31E007|nr:YheC/YheD family protein [Phosphitispora fastidiosa]MBU7006670.1 glutathione synthase/RimK-type ligase-like ATP-grasp enzyme [Phosphitispora fastidiosa]